MGRHAYLIIAHNQFELLKILLNCIDDERNDIYLHIDKKVESYPVFHEAVSKSRLYLVENRISVNWGGVSQIEAEFALLEEATRYNEKYDYYHLLSGVDLPIKTQTQIHDFFDKNKGKEFVNYESRKFQYSYRVKYYWFFQEYNGKKAVGVGFFVRCFNKVSTFIQRLAKIDRRNGFKYQKGSQWFSITGGLAHDLVNNKDRILAQYRNTTCGDELFVQTFVLNSEHKKQLYSREFDNTGSGAMRYIVWKENKNSPEAMTMANFEALKRTGMLFARKFDFNAHPDVVEKVVKELCRK